MALIAYYRTYYVWNMLMNNLKFIPSRKCHGRYIYIIPKISKYTEADDSDDNDSNSDIFQTLPLQL